MCLKRGCKKFVLSLRTATGKYILWTEALTSFDKCTDLQTVMDVQTEGRRGLNERIAEFVPVECIRMIVRYIQEYSVGNASNMSFYMKKKSANIQRQCPPVDLAE